MAENKQIQPFMGIDGWKIIIIYIQNISVTLNLSVQPAMINWLVNDYTLVQGAANSNRLVNLSLYSVTWNLSLILYFSS